MNNPEENPQDKNSNLLPEELEDAKEIVREVRNKAEELKSDKAEPGNTELSSGENGAARNGRLNSQEENPVTKEPETKVEPYDRKRKHSDSAEVAERPTTAPEAAAETAPKTEGKELESTKPKESSEVSTTENQEGSSQNKTPVIRKPRGSAKGVIKTAGRASGMNSIAKTANTLKDQTKDASVSKDLGGGESEDSAAVGAAKKVGKAAVAKLGLALKGLFLSPKGLIVLLVLILIPIAGLIYIIANDTVNRTLSHTQKYGCVEDKFTLDFLEQLAPGEGASLKDRLGSLFSESESSCTDASGAGWTGEFYPPTIGRITSYWYYDAPANTNFHGATDIAAYEGAPIFAYAGGEVISRVDGTANAAGWNGSGCNWGAFAPWSYAKTVQGDIVISHQPGIFESRYSHMWKKDMFVRVGDIVSAGDHIAGQGNTGWSCGNHLHFELKENGQPIDPYYHMLEQGIVYPISLESLPPKPEGNTGGGGNAEGVDPGLMAYAAKTLSDNGMPTSASEKTCLAKLWNRESNWRHTAENPSSGAYGIPQSLPGSKMSSEGEDWRTNPETQIRWGIKYIKSRYGTPCEAWAHSERVNWY